MADLTAQRESYVQALHESLERLVNVLAAREDVLRISLFGSYARGRRDLFTDLDVVVIMDTQQGLVDRLRTLYPLLALPVDLELLCYTPAEWDSLQDRPSSSASAPRRSFSMRRSALEEGKRWLGQAMADLHWASDLAERGGYHLAWFSGP